MLRSDTEADTQPVTFLTSRGTGLVSVYDVSRGEDDLVHMNAPSNCLPFTTPHGGLPITGWNLFQHPLMDPSHIDVLHLSSRGDINRLHAHLGSDDDVDQSASDQSQGFIWSDEVKELASANLGVTGLGRLVIRESSTVDLGPAYKGSPPPSVPLGMIFAHTSQRSFLPYYRRRRERGRYVRCSGPPPLFLAKPRCPGRSHLDHVSLSNCEATHSLTAFLPEAMSLAG